MTPEQFCFWLQGLFELSDPKQLTKAQVKMVKEHLDLVFEHAAGEPAPPLTEEEQALGLAKRSDLYPGDPSVVAKMTDEELEEKVKAFRKRYPDPLKSMSREDFAAFGIVGKEQIGRELKKTQKESKKRDSLPQGWHPRHPFDRSHPPRRIC